MVIAEVAMPSSYDLSVRSLNLLRIAIETRSVTATAERLHVSQPTVSKAIQLAEQRLGFPLFNRERGRLVPTVDARVLLPQIARALAAVESVKRLAEDLQGLKTGLITLAATPVLANTLAASAIGRFSTRWAGVQVAIQTMVNNEVVQAVADHSVELGLVLTPVEDGYTLARDICTAGLQCVMPHSHVLARCLEIAPRDLAPFPLISFSRHEPIGALIEDAFRSAGIRRRIAVEVNQSSTACALVEAGAGVTILDGFTALSGFPRGLVARPFQPAARITGRLLLPADRPPSRHSEAFVQTLASVVSDEIAGGRIKPCLADG